MIFATYLPPMCETSTAHYNTEDTHFFFWYPSKLPSKVLVGDERRVATSVGRTFELLSNVSHFFVDPLLFQLPYSSTANVRDELRDLVTGYDIVQEANHLRQTTHRGRHD